MNTKIVYTIPKHEHGWRLDKVITFTQPTISLRTCRRLIKCGLIHIKNIQTGQTKPSFKVTYGQNVSIEIPKELPIKNTDTFPCTIISIQNSLLAIYKPAGIHTAYIKGSMALSLEKILQKNSKNHPLLSSKIHKNYQIQLLNRLDQQTSGIIIATINSSGESLWREAEQSGSIYKYYLTIVEGKIEKPIIITNKLYTQNRVKTKATSTITANTLRHTFVKPIKIYKNSELQNLFPETTHNNNSYLTLIECIIKKGMRHQIRAHLSARGFPIAGDHLYGSKISSSFLLHHYKTILPGFKVHYLPEWLKTLNKDDKPCVLLSKNMSIPPLDKEL